MSIAITKTLLGPDCPHIEFLNKGEILYIAAKKGIDIPTEEFDTQDFINAIRRRLKINEELSKMKNYRPKYVQYQRYPKRPVPAG